MRIQTTLLLATLLTSLPLTSFGEDDMDPFLWLEDIEGEKALEWVEERNTE